MLEAPAGPKSLIILFINYTKAMASDPIDSKEK